jgi:predicted nuclease of predicted toxin-antitoxin system
MRITILLDHDVEGQAVFLQAGLREIGWDQLLTVEFARLRDCGLPDDTPDRDIWRFAQQHRLLLITNNRNSEDETSLAATIEREGAADSLPVITVAQVDRLRLADYRQRAATSLVEIIISPEAHLGRGRVFIP